MIRKLRVTVNGRSYDVTVETLHETPAAAVGTTPVAAAAPAPAAASAPELAAAAPASAAHHRDGAQLGEVVSPLAGRLVSYEVTVGQRVEAGAQVATLEAMKMHTTVHADTAGTVQALLATPGEAVEEGRPLLRIG